MRSEVAKPTLRKICEFCSTEERMRFHLLPQVLFACIALGNEMTLRAWVVVNGTKDHFTAYLRNKNVGNYIKIIKWASSLGICSVPGIPLPSIYMNDAWPYFIVLCLLALSLLIHP